jgi:DNA primase
MAYDLQELKDVPIRDLARLLSLDFPSSGRGNARCFNQSFHTHGDRTPSLGFEANTNRYKCFGCGKSGDTISLVSETQGIGFKESCEWLANQFSLSDVTKTGKYQGKSQVSQSIKKVVYREVLEQYQPPTEKDIEIYQKYYELNPILDEGGKAYLISKGFNDETIERFGWRTITKVSILELRKLFTHEELTASGILGILQAGWLLIPYFQDDRIVYLRARNHVSKTFRNLKDKQTTYYNYNALVELTGANSLYLCEGETDTMTLSQQGHPAIGVMGATQDATINRLVGFILNDFGNKLRVVLAFDNDEPGRTATKKAADMFWRKGLKIKTLDIPSGYKDVNDYHNDRPIKEEKDGQGNQGITTNRLRST